MSKIPCTVAVLTHNSGKTLQRCFESIKDFAEIIICDGASTDDTLHIAARYGARVVAQDVNFLEVDGRIAHFGNIRNQTLRSATYEWFFFLDSDECLDKDIVAEIEQKLTGTPAAFWVPRKYVYRDVVIDHSVAYPSQQMRFFNRTVVKEFIKQVHEKIELKPGVVPHMLVKPMFVPIPDTAREMILKWRRYLAIEGVYRTPLTSRQWFRGAIHDGGIAVRYVLRLLHILMFTRGTRLPISYELARVWYQYRLIVDSLRAVRFW